ncbi:hypothetical protein CCACVL1_03405 [Corchorus capsularis]|uniref:Uncharacterized protein n=1 Tax=Corchorus capsularis TaxID=210143 RepID=A0A1R3JZR1_COCAP|nr:hypothetical protein CCACVL1_03405 [Corchorus capsularis]
MEPSTDPRSLRTDRNRLSRFYRVLGRVGLIAAQENNNQT